MIPAVCESQNLVLGTNICDRVTDNHPLLAAFHLWLDVWVDSWRCYRMYFQNKMLVHRGKTSNPRLYKVDQELQRIGRMLFGL
jgi:hypothetical protein